MYGIGKSIETERRLVLARDWGRGTGSDCLMGTRFPVGVRKTFWNQMEVGAQHGECTKHH